MTEETHVSQTLSTGRGEETGYEETVGEHEGDQHGPVGGPWGRPFSPFAQLLQYVEDFLGLFGQTVLAQLLQLPAGTNTRSSEDTRFNTEFMSFFSFQSKIVRTFQMSASKSPNV